MFGRVVNTSVLSLPLNLYKFVCHQALRISLSFSPFHVNGFFLYSLKKSENQEMFDVSGDIERDHLHEMGYMLLYVLFS